MDYDYLKGSTLNLSKTVEPHESAAKYGSGLVEVFATPAMVAFIEKTCMLAVADKLPSGFGTVGVAINVSHEKATPIGATVTCKSELIEVQGRKLVFEVEANDHNGRIGKGFHERFIIDTAKFMAKLN